FAYIQTHHAEDAGEGRPDANPLTAIDFLREAPLRYLLVRKSHGADRRTSLAQTEGLVARHEAGPASPESRSFGRAQAVVWNQVTRGALPQEVSASL
ncbi:hypothetical protein, partial [Longimicrobium sp.]|uniref:hypothetical protein n=1 Tax=Longimicrobium sp. TaxID=2029185 RepID=UPI002F94AA64